MPQIVNELRFGNAVFSADLYRRKGLFFYQLVYGLGADPQDLRDLRGGQRRRIAAQFFSCSFFVIGNSFLLHLHGRSVVFLVSHIFLAVGCGGEDTDRKPDNGTEVGGIFLRLNALSAFLRVLGSAVNYTASFQNTAQASSDSATADTAVAIIIFNIFRCSFSIVLSRVSVLFERVSEQFEINCS